MNPTPITPRPRSRTQGFSLIEILVALGIFGLAMTAVTTQMIESVQLSLKTARTLEYSRSSRHLVDTLSKVVRDAQSVVVYSEITDQTPVSATGYGNYVVAHQINTAGTITRTIGYYLKANAGGQTYTLYCHDSAAGGPAAGTLPAGASSGSHRMTVRTVRIPAGSGVKLFRNWQNQGVSLRGQFGQSDKAPTGNLEYVQCTFTTRS